MTIKSIYLPASEPVDRISFEWKRGDKKNTTKNEYSTNAT